MLKIKDNIVTVLIANSRHIGYCSWKAPLLPVHYVTAITFRQNLELVRRLDGWG
jgi:hypothetical protein